MPDVRLNLVKGVRDIAGGKSASGGVSAMGGVVLIATPPHALDGPEHTGQLPIERLSTAETDAAMVLAPDGAGGIEARIPAGSIVCGFDGGGSPLTGGATQDVYIPSARTITNWTLIADQTGDATIGVLVGTLTNLIAGSPPVASITAANDPELSGDVGATDSTLAGWTTALAAGDVVRFVLSAVDGVQTKLTLSLTTA
jgi:hypothetical protein